LNTASNEHHPDGAGQVEIVTARRFHSTPETGIHLAIPSGRDNTRKANARHNAQDKGELFTKPAKKAGVSF
jgi:hypothetical protein